MAINIKKLVVVYLFIVVFVVNGCNTNKREMNQSNDKLDTPTPNTSCLEQKIESENKTITYAIYQVGDGAVDEFTKSILDKISYEEYDEEIEKATTTAEIIIIQKQYIEKWKEEMHNAEKNIYLYYRKKMRPYLNKFKNNGKILLLIILN